MCTQIEGNLVTLYDVIGGGMAVHFKDRILTATAYGTYSVPDPAEDKKTIDDRLDAIVASPLCQDRTVRASPAVITLTRYGACR
jgi:hypothetical protein